MSAVSVDPSAKVTVTISPSSSMAVAVLERWMRCIPNVSMSSPCRSARATGYGRCPVRVVTGSSEKRHMTSPETPS